MELTSATTILQAVAQYGVLGLGWVAWIFTMFYIQRERKQYQDLVIHIVQYFTKVNLVDRKAHEDSPVPLSSPFDGPGMGGIEQLFGRGTGAFNYGQIQSESKSGRSNRSTRSKRRTRTSHDEDVND
jgi:hypothetical protein